MTPTWRNFSRNTWVEVVPLPPKVAERKGLKIPLTPTRVVVKEGVTCVPLMRLNLKQVHPLCSTVNLSMTRGDLVMPFTATTAVVVCCRWNDSNTPKMEKL